ncbi:MAG: hypothetical protein Q8O67_07030 [Deltaproteobacteria bacterium]|nr:hypothetical protein [Deltaproteobacteria bacterium]
MNVAVAFAFAFAATAPDLSGFQKLPADPPPAEITRGAHYWIGNEDRLDVFYDDVKDKGGVHVGVGAEQNWLLAGWSKPQVIVMMDFDQSIVDLHRVYLVAFAKAATKEEFKALWLDKSRKGLREGIIATVAKADRPGALEALNVARWSIERRFARLETQMAAKGLTSFLTDDAQYAVLRELVTSGRAFTVRGDLTATRTMRAIAAAASTAALPIRTLYLSNAEQYFMYKKDTRANFASLPFDDESVVMRTHGWVSLPWLKDGNSYHYGVQSGPSFKAFAADPLVWASRQILQWAPADTEKGTSKLTSTSPAEVKAAFEVRAAEEKAAKLAKAKEARPKPKPKAESDAP